MERNTAARPGNTPFRQKDVSGFRFISGRRTVVVNRKRIFVLCLLIALAIAGAIVFYLVKRRHDYNNIISGCTASQFIVDNAIAQFASKHNLTNGSSVEPIDLLPYFPSFFTTNRLIWHMCPAGGKFSLGKVGEPPVCSIHGSLIITCSVPVSVSYDLGLPGQIRSYHKFQINR